MLFSAFHMVLHFLVPGLVARYFFKDQQWRAWLVMISTMLVDVDHLLASPVFDPNRCGIGFHPLHTWPALALYVLLALVPATRLVGLGLVIHMVLDSLDCLRMSLGLG